ncbi:hypothetical protein Tco_1367679 [Tanacetum coccineum]
MSELLDDAIGVSHWIFDFSGVRIPFSSFLVAIIKHYKVHFTPLGPLGLNKVVTFEVLCRSLQIEPTMTLFRVFQTLCKQGHWAIPDYMSWRHPILAIDDSRPPTDSFNMDDVRQLSAHLVKLRDMPEGVLVLSRLSHVWKSQTCDPLLRGVNGNVMGIHDFLCLPEWTGAEVQEEPHHDIRPTLQRLPFYCTPPAAVLDPTPKDLVVGTPSVKLSGSTTRPSLFVDNSDEESDDDDDTCVEIPLVTPIRSTSPPHPSFGHAPSFKEVSRDAIHRDFYPFSAGPYYATYPEVFKDPAVCKTVVDQFPTSREMVRIEALTSDQLNAKMSVLHYLMMSHYGELLDRYCGLLQSHHDYVQSTDSRLKGFQEKFASLSAKGKERKKKKKSLTKCLNQLNAEVARLSTALNQATVLEAEKDEEILWLKASPSKVQGELLSLAASAGFERGLSMHQTREEFAEVLMKTSYFVPSAQDRLAKASPLVAQTEDTCVSPLFTKESNVTPVSLSIELLYNTIPSSSIALLEPNEEWVNAMVDRPNNEMTGGAGNGKSGDVFVQGDSHVVDDDVELTLVGSKRVSSGPNYVVVALSAREKCGGSIPSLVDDENAAATPSRV